MLTRRHFVITGAALFSTPITTAAPAFAGPTSDPDLWDTWDASVIPANYDAETSNPWGFHPRFLPQVVQANDGLTAGDIHVDAIARYLYFIQDDGTALRFGVAIAKDDLYIPGNYRIQRKAKWPTWTPTANMIRREPESYAQFAGGVDGGPTNPLGARAFYLFRGNRDTYLRIHGTPFPGSIGGRASSGCVRMVMAHIIGLYSEVKTGSRAILHPGEDRISATS